MKVFILREIYDSLTLGVFTTPKECVELYRKVVSHVPHSEDLSIWVWNTDTQRYKRYKMRKYDE